MEPYLITERCEYDYAVSRGFEPLIDTKHFRLDIRLRIELQREKFGHCVFGRGADIMAANARFFKWVWAHKPHRCEETLRMLYAAVTGIFRNVLFPHSHAWRTPGNGK